MTKCYWCKELLDKGHHCPGYDTNQYALNLVMAACGQTVYGKRGAPELTSEQMRDKANRLREYANGIKLNGGEVTQGYES